MRKKDVTLPDATLNLTHKPLPVKIKDGNVFACDVDDTLLMWTIPEGYDGPLVETNLAGIKETHRPNIPAVEHLKKMKARGFAVIVWSAGGSDWAEAAVKALELEEYVDVIMPKIDFHLDDVEDPKDKIGQWQYITPEGKVFKKKNGKVVERKNDLIIERTNKVLEEK